jgi:hypothetical protein
MIAWDTSIFLNKQKSMNFEVKEKKKYIVKDPLAFEVHVDKQQKYTKRPYVHTVYTVKCNNR